MSEPVAPTRQVVFLVGCRGTRWEVLPRAPKPMLEIAQGLRFLDILIEDGTGLATSFFWWGIMALQSRKLAMAERLKCRLPQRNISAFEEEAHPG